MGHLDRIGSHEADLAAHTRNPLEELVVGEYYNGGWVGQTQSGSFDANVLHGMPFLVARAMTVDRIAVDVKTAAAGKKARLGIYQSNGSGAPGTLVLDAGEVALDTTGIKAITINQQLSKGLHFVAVTSDGTPNLAMVYGSTHSHFPAMGIKSSDFRFPNQQYRAGVSYGALPDPFSGGSTGYGECVIVALRISSLD